MMEKRQNLHINLHSPHFCKRNSLYVRYLQRDTADLKSADRKRSWGFKSPSGHHRNQIGGVRHKFDLLGVVKWFLGSKVVGLYPRSEEPQVSMDLACHSQSPAQTDKRRRTRFYIEAGQEGCRLRHPSTH